MTEDNLEYGRQEMEKILSELKTTDCPNYKKPNYALVVPRSHPALVAKGSNSLVFELPSRETREGRVYLVGKGFKYTESSTWGGVPEDELHLIGCNSGLVIDGYGLDTTHYWLRQMDLGVKLPAMKEFHGSFGKKYLHFTIMPDLREGGKYEVEEAEGPLFQRLENGASLEETREIVCRDISQKVNGLGLVVLPAGHGSEENILPALEHMFLVQCSGNTGKLVLGDLNHLAIHERGRKFGIKPTYLSE